MSANVTTQNGEATVTFSYTAAYSKVIGALERAACKLHGEGKGPLDEKCVQIPWDELLLMAHDFVREAIVRYAKAGYVNEERDEAVEIASADAETLYSLGE